MRVAESLSSLGEEISPEEVNGPGRLVQHVLRESGNP